MDPFDSPTIHNFHLHRNKRIKHFSALSSTNEVKSAACSHPDRTSTLSFKVTECSTTASQLFLKSNICHFLKAPEGEPLCCLCSTSYLQAQPDSLGDGRLGEDGLDVGHQLAAEPAALWPDEVALLLNAGDHGKVEGEVGGNDPTDSLLLQLFLTLQVYRCKTGQERISLWPPASHMEIKPAVALTFIHAIQNSFQHFVTIAIAVFFPHRAVLTAEDHQLPVPSAQRGKVGDFHNDWPVETQQQASLVKKDN